MRTATLLSNQTANGAGDGLQAEQVGSATVFTHGTFDTCTVTFQISPDNTNWFAVTDAAFTADGYIAITFPESVYVRAEVTSVGASSSVSAIIVYD